jgi:hypothetical protein
MSHYWRSSFDAKDTRANCYQAGLLAPDVVACLAFPFTPERWHKLASVISLLVFWLREEKSVSYSSATAPDLHRLPYSAVTHKEQRPPDEYKTFSGASIRRLIGLCQCALITTKLYNEEVTITLVHKGA